MEENVKFNLVFPYHINTDELVGNVYHDKNFLKSYHTHSFSEVLRIAYLESKAFYLTEEDKKCYSNQEIEFIEKVLECERTKIDNGMVLVDLELSEETLGMIEKYKQIHNMTFEEAVNDILIKAIEDYKEQEQD